MKILSIILLSAILLGGIVYKFFLPTEQTLVSTLVYPKAKLLPNFTLIDHKSTSFTNEQLNNKWSVVFFGFTYCPDVCPTTLAALSQIAKKLPPETLSQLQFVLGRLNILINLFLLGTLIYLSQTLPGETSVSEKGIGMFLPVIVILLLVIANKAIKKDEDLVKSVDRLR